MDFNKNLFNAFKGGSALQSPSLTQSSNVKIKAQAQALRLASATVQMMLANEGKKSACIVALNNAGDGADVFKAHAQKSLDEFLDNMNVSSVVKEIETYVDAVPDSCANFTSLVGSITGGADALLSSTEALIDELDQGITDYEVVNLPLSDFHDLLDRVTSELASSLAGLLGLVQNEIEGLDALRQKHKAMQQALTVESLIKDDCVRPMLYQLSGPSLAGILTDEFNVIDEVL
jgi:hypothetical protein